MKNNLSDNIKKLRKDNNLSQEDLADKLSVSRQSISKWEQGDAYPEMDKLMQMAELFNVSLDNLVHSDVSEVKAEENSNKIIGKWVNEATSFITDTINLFARMNLKSKLKFIMEELIIIFLLGFTFSVVGEICAAVVSNLYVIPGYKYLYLILETLYEVFAFVVSVLLVIHIYKVRYLNYYRSIINGKREEKTTEVNEKEEKITVNQVEDRIVIRDPKTSEYSFFKAISDLFILFLKAISFYIMIGVCFALIGLAFAFGLSVLIINSGSFYVGVIITIVSSIISLSVILLVLINFIFNRISNKKVLGLLFVISIIFFGIGIGITTASLTSFNTYDIRSAEIPNDGIVITMNDKAYISNEYSIDYIEEDRSDIKITPVDGTCEVEYTIRSDGRIDLNQYCSFINKIKFIIKEVNNKRFYIDKPGYYNEYKIFASKKNIEKLKKNTISYYKKVESDK